MASIFSRKSPDLVAGAKSTAAKATTAKAAGAKPGVTKVAPAKASPAKTTRSTAVKSTGTSSTKATSPTKATSLKATTLKATTEAEAEARKGYTQSKKDLGVATPKRKAAGRVEAAPTNRREAMKRMRAKQRESRVEQRAGMMAGKEEHLLPRDKGPERALVRDIVDSRRNVASIFMPGALIVLAATVAPAGVRVYANALWLAMFVGVAVDSFLLSRRVGKLVGERFPKAKPSRYYWYAIMRSLSIRRMRIPNPRVKPGQAV